MTTAGGAEKSTWYLRREEIRGVFFAAVLGYVIGSDARWTF